jgi:fructokinase
MQIDFLAIGEVLADLITTEYSEGLEDAKAFKIFPGGSPANVAANLKYLRKEAGLVGCVGNDGGKTISLDWNFAPSIWGADDGIAIFKIIAQLQPLLKISTDDMERFFGEGLSIERCKEALNHFTFSTVCLTCGREGVWYKTENGEWIHKPALLVKKVLDTTGAGDAFWAGFIAAYLEGHAIDGCVTNALEIAAKKIQKQGPLYL